MVNLRVKTRLLHRRSTALIDLKDYGMLEINRNRVKSVTATMFFVSFALVLFELQLTRLFGVILFAQFAHLALGLALLGISIGSVIQHLKPDIIPEEDMENRLANVVMLMCISMLLAVVCSIVFPVTEQFEKPPTVYQERSSISGNLLSIGWFVALLPVLALPFVFAGIAFSGAFFRMKSHIGTLYGSDLIGGAVGAAFFIPLLSVLSAPDTTFFAMLMLSVSAILLLRGSAHRIKFFAIAATALICLAASIVGMTGHEVLKIKYAAGYSELNVTYTKWTPLTRLAVHEDQRGAYVLLDNSSASEVLLTDADRARKAKEINRSFVFQLHTPPARTAILASSAGPEVAVAQYYGYTDIDAVDIAGEIAEVVRSRFPDAPTNPFIVGNTHQINADGRAAILHAKQPYDIIQMVHANLHSNAGLLANAWSPALLETKQAFATYLEKLSEKGTISFGKGPATMSIATSAAAALTDRGVKEPWRHIAYLTGNAVFMLVKKIPWSGEELDKLRAVAKKNRCRLEWDPSVKPPQHILDMLSSPNVMTDNKPYLDTFSDITDTAAAFFSEDKNQNQLAINSLYTSILAQIAFIVAAGIFFLFVPLMRRGPTGLKKIKGVGIGLGYVSCIGYGYLAVEIVLIHELILFIGHPTYAVTAVILSMLLFSGIGSILAGKIPANKLTTSLRLILLSVLVLGALQAWVFPQLLYQFALGLPMPVRFMITLAILAPLGLVMGMPFPTAIRILPESASGIIPWAWALNGWMSVVAGLMTMVISRVVGYSQAIGLALVFYAGALVLAGMLRKISLKAAPTATATSAE